MRLSAFYVVLFVLAGCQQATEEPAGTEATATETPKAPEPGAVKPVRFGVLPSLEAGQLERDYGPLAAQLAELLDKPVELVVPKSYDALLEDMIKGDIDLGQLSAHVYIAGAGKRLRAGVETNVLAQQRMASEKPHRGLIVVKRGSGFQSLKDLEGKRIAYVDKGSSSGYWYPRMKLREKGLDPDKHFGETKFAGSHKASLELLRKGEVDAACVSMLTAGEPEDLTTLEHTEVIPDDAIVELGALTEAERKSVTDFFLQAHEKPALKPFMTARGIDKYVPADINVYLAQEKEMKRDETASR